MGMTGSLPSASTYGTWFESMEIRSADDDTLWDTSSLTEVQVKLRDPRTGNDELVLRLSSGEVTLPSLGIVQWRAEQTAMGTLPAKLYEVIILLQDSTDILPFVVGTMSVTGEGITFQGGI
jgi:hypothetical protein